MVMALLFTVIRSEHNYPYAGDNLWHGAGRREPGRRAVRRHDSHRATENEILGLDLVKYRNPVSGFPVCWLFDLPGRTLAGMGPMSLIQELLEIISKENLATPKLLAQHLNVSQELIELILADLERSGYLQAATGNCTGCTECGICKTCASPGSRLWFRTVKA
jgi:hypothetical protein